MKTLLVRYTSTLIYVSVLKPEYGTLGAFSTESFSSKEITKLLVPTMQGVLQSNTIAVDTITAIAATVGPAPTFSHRSMLAAINGIKTAQILEHKELLLYAIDDFLLTHEYYQNQYPKKFVVSLYNAFSQELFYIYTQDNQIKRGIWQDETFIVALQQCAKNNLVVIGLLSDNQKLLLRDAGITYQEDLEFPEHDFCKTVSELLGMLEPVPFLLPLYTKLHHVEKKL